MKFNGQAIKYRNGDFQRPKNDVRVHEHRTFPHAHYAEVKTNCGFTENQLVAKSEVTYKVVYNGLTTVVILDDGSKGIAKCNPKDRYDTQKGHEIAHKRASVKKLKKELDRLCS